MKYKIGVIFGGESVEHEISIISANQAINALDPDKYEVIPIYVSKNRQLYFSPLLSDLNNYKDLDTLIKKSREIVLVKERNKVKVRSAGGLTNKTLAEIDILVPVVHGTNSEDGTFQGYSEMLGLPYTGSGIQAASVGQDKVFMRQILQQEGLPLVDWQWFYLQEYENDGEVIIKDIIKNLGFPVIVKPANLGSSIGVATADNKKELKEAIEFAGGFDEKIVVEKMVSELLEVNCAVLGDHTACIASQVEEVAKSEEFLSYQDKYEGGSKSKGMVNTARIIPARLSEADTLKVKELAKAAFIALDCSGVVRVDFLYDRKQQEFYVNEINSIPGSLAFYLWQPTGISFGELMDRLIQIALDRYRRKAHLTYSYSSNVLKNYKGSKGVKKI